MGYTYIVTVWRDPGLFDSLSALGAYCLSYLNWWNVLEENKEKNDLVQKDLPKKTFLK